MKPKIRKPMPPPTEIHKPKVSYRRQANREAEADALASHVCPACGCLMIEDRCKLGCKNCGFFHDCGDGMI